MLRIKVCKVKIMAFGLALPGIEPPISKQKMENCRERILKEKIRETMRKEDDKF